jgi:hypothetical protein
MTRKKIFISHVLEDSYIVPLLDRLLELHGHAPWYAQSDLRAGELFHEKIEEELAGSDVLIVVASRRTLSSAWVTTEVAKFRALKPLAPVIPIVLDDLPKKSLNRISPGLSDVHAISFRDCLLDGFQKLFAALGRDFLSRRELSNRRVGPDRRGAVDRRAASVRQRLSMGLLVTYTRETGRSVAEATRLTARDLEALRQPLLRELSRYVYRCLRDRASVSVERVVETVLRYARGLLSEKSAMDAVELLRLLAAHVCGEYEVRMIERRERVRRREDPPER